MDTQRTTNKLATGERTRAVCEICKEEMIARDVRADNNICSKQCGRAFKMAGKYRSHEKCTTCKGSGQEKGGDCLRCGGKGGWYKGTISKALGVKLLRKFGDSLTGVEKEEAIKVIQRRGESDARKLQATRSDRYRELGVGRRRQV